MVFIAKLQNAKEAVADFEAKQKTPSKVSLPKRNRERPRKSS